MVINEIDRDLLGFSNFSKAQNFGKVKSKILIELQKEKCNSDNGYNGSQDFFPVDFFLE